MFRHRFLTAIFGIPIILAFLYLFDGNFFFLLILFLSIVALNEFYRLFKTYNYKPITLLLFLSSFILVIASNWGKIQGLIVAFFLMVALILIVVWLTKKEMFLPVFLATVLGVFYIPFLLSHLILLKNISPAWVLAVLFGTWITDISAYSVGSLIGKTKLAPAISPNKTLEGAMSAIIICSLLFLFFTFLPGTNWWNRLFFGLIIGFFTVVGDLIESKIKRSFKVKDTGNIIPGHGGFLDRFDSLIITGTAGFYTVIIFFSQSGKL